jgi:hypothetical protein
MATHKGHFRWHNEEEIYGKAQWTRVYFVLKIEERALYIYRQKKVCAPSFSRPPSPSPHCTAFRLGGAFRSSP